MWNHWNILRKQAFKKIQPPEFQQRIRGKNVHRIESKIRSHKQIDINLIS